MATNKFSERDGGTACARFMHAHASAQRTHLKPRQAWAKAGSASNITLDMNLRPTKNLIIKFDIDLIIKFDMIIKFDIKFDNNQIL